MFRAAFFNAEILMERALESKSTEYLRGLVENTPLILRLWWYIGVSIGGHAVVFRHARRILERRGIKIRYLDFHYSTTLELLNKDI